MSELALYLFAPMLVGAAGGFAAGAYGGERRWTLLLIWLVLPLFVYTLWAASLPPASQGGFWIWWGVGLMYLALPFFGWAVGASIAFAEALRRWR